jgi:hypothetical protein
MRGHEIRYIAYYGHEATAAIALLHIERWELFNIIFWFGVFILNLGRPKDNTRVFGGKKRSEATAAIASGDIPFCV